MKIIALNVKNVKRIKAVEIVPKDNLVTISGRNAQGKSSILDSIIYALGGTSNIPSKPIRDGEEFAEVIIQTDEYAITRHWTSNDKSYLKVFPQDESLRDKFGEIKRPQELLDSIVGKLSFDPFEFVRSKSNIDILKRMVGLDFRDIDTKKVNITEERRRINSKMRDLQAYDKEILNPELNLPDKQIDTNKLMQSLTHIQDLHAQRNRTIEALKEHKITLGRLEEQIIHLKGTIIEEEELVAVKLPEVEPIKLQIASATEVNKKIQQRDLKSQIENQIGDLKVQSEQYTQELKDLESEKLDRISNVKFPIEGLSLNDEGIIYKNVPLSQISQSEQLLVGLSVGASLNPNLKVILAKDASVLDTNNLDLLRGWAKDKDYQVWIERVEEDDSNAIIIEDGEVKSDMGIELTFLQNEEKL